MFNRILSLLIFGFITITYADSAIQTDWSGKSGVWGPVFDWSNDYCLDTDIQSYKTGSCFLQYNVKYCLAGSTVHGAYAVFSEDFNSDGNMDIVAAKWGSVILWLNVDGTGEVWQSQGVGGCGLAHSVYSEDIDGDGDMDILAPAFYSDKIILWINTDGSGTDWTECVVDDTFEGAESVYTEDIDGDGDMDILGTGGYVHSVTWWENIDGQGTSWTEYTIDENFTGASVYSEDIDSDGDMDVLGAGFNSDTIIWWENYDSAGSEWIKHEIVSDYHGACSILGADIDNDGDVDILGAARYDEAIKLWENVDGQGTSWIERDVGTGLSLASEVFVRDIDGDGDLDVLGAAGNGILWWENIDGSGTSWDEHFVDENSLGARAVYSEDINNDGNMDVIGATLYYDNAVSWWNLTGYACEGSLESSVLDTGSNPNWNTIDWITIEPLGTFIEFQVRSSAIPEPDSMGAWSDTLSTPCSLEGILEDGDQYVQYRAVLTSIDSDTTPVLEEMTITWDDLGIEDGAELIPNGFELLSFNPNPVLGFPTIRFGLPEYSLVELIVYDVSGRVVYMVPKDDYYIGYHTIILGKLSPGIYFCRMISGNFAETQRFVVIQ